MSISGGAAEASMRNDKRKEEKRRGEKTPALWVRFVTVLRESEGKLNRSG